MQPVDMDFDACIELESKVWDALRRVDAEADARLLSDDYVGVYPTVTIPRFPGRFGCGVGDGPQRLGSSAVFIRPAVVAGSELTFRTSR